MFEQSLIKDSEGYNLFNLNIYTKQKQFACDIIINSTLPSSKADEGNNNSTVKNLDEDESTDKIKKYNKGYFKIGSSGIHFVLGLL